GAEEGRASHPRRLLDAGPRLLAPRPAVREVARDDVETGLEQPADLVEVGVVRRVADAVGAARDQRVDVVGRGDAAPLHAAELAHVPALLLGAPRVGAHELELRMLEDRLDRLPTHVAGGPLQDSDRHRLAPMRRWRHTGPVEEAGLLLLEVVRPLLDL